MITFSMFYVHFVRIQERIRKQRHGLLVVTASRAFRVAAPTILEQSV